MNSSRVLSSCLLSSLDEWGLLVTPHEVRISSASRIQWNKSGQTNRAKWGIHGVTGTITRVCVCVCKCVGVCVSLSYCLCVCVTGCLLFVCVCVPCICCCRMIGCWPDRSLLEWNGCCGRLYLLDSFTYSLHFSTFNPSQLLTLVHVWDAVTRRRNQNPLSFDAHSVGIMIHVFGLFCQNIHVINTLYKVFVS